MVEECGIHAAKVSLRADTRADEASLDALLTALGETEPATLAVDLGLSATPKAAIRRVRALEKRFDIAWLEGAAPDCDFPGLKQVSDAVRAAVSVGRRLGAPSEFLPHFQHRSADVIDLDIGLTGITGALLLADAAYSYELPVTLAATTGNIAAHLASVMPYFMSLEVVEPEPATSLCLSDVRIEGGYAVAGDAHGHGLRVRRAASQAGVPS
jgi:L-alanine-DL-glutamate epimerase-like enolase superfamily enzyme